MTTLTTTTAPLGLRAVFAAVRADNEEYGSARSDAAKFGPMAEQLLDDDLDTFANYKAIRARLIDASKDALADDPTLTGRDRDELIALEAFRLGVAVGWRLTSAIGGGR